MIAALSVEVVGDGKTRVVFVHGSGSVDVWSNQLVLADRLPARLEFVRRTGYPPSPIGGPLLDPLEDAGLLAERLEQGAHLVGFSYGGLSCLLAAGLNPVGVQSLTVIEPPLFSIAQGVEVVDAVADRLAAVYHAAATISAEEFDRRFDLALGFDNPPTEFTPEELTMIDAERRELFPGDVMLPLGLIEADYPKRVISGTWSEAFSAVCDRLAETIGAERFSLTGGHSAQSVPEFQRVAHCGGSSPRRVMGHSHTSFPLMGKGL